MLGRNSRNIYLYNSASFVIGKVLVILLFLYWIDPIFDFKFGMYNYYSLATVNGLEDLIIIILFLINLIERRAFISLSEILKFWKKKSLQYLKIVFPPLKTQLQHNEKNFPFHSISHSILLLNVYYTQSSHHSLFLIHSKWQRHLCVSRKL